MNNNIIDFLKEAISEETHLEKSILMNKESFENYGIESVMMVSITRKLEKRFGELPKTLFFEYSNIEELAKYLNDNYSDNLVLEEQAITVDEEIEEEAAEKEINEVVDIFELEEEEEESDGDDVVEETQLDDIEKEGAFIDLSSITDSLDKSTEEEIDDNQSADIAIIGISGRFPEADNLDEFWDNISKGKDCITEVPSYLWDWKKYWNPNKGVKGKSYTKWGGFLRDADKFDPLFFNISNLEAESIDPQERIFLETVYHTIENAGYTRETLNNYRVGVYVGVMWGQYQLYGSRTAEAQSSYASIANRVSYFFNFNGPSIALDTMCSSSLTSVHLACESLKNKEIDIAVAGGVNVDTHPNKHLYLSKTGFASTDGRCRSFGEGGDGYVPGDGSGALLLKPLSKALNDGDNIYGVIKSTAINHGGKAQGYTVPNPKAQTELVEGALKKVNIKADTLSYMEMHGTGTSLGDPIEIRALTNVFKQATERKEFVPIGSVKSNIGHLESAAGFAGIAKVILQMKHKKIVPSIHSDILNPNINFAETPFYVQRELSEWKETSNPRRAGVSSFGAGGANGFVLLEEFKDKKEYPSYDGEKLIILSAREKNQLDTKISDLYTYLNNRKNYLEYEKLLDKASIKEMLLEHSGIDKKFIDDDDELIDIGINFEGVNESFKEYKEIVISENEFNELNSLESLVNFINNKYESAILEKNNRKTNDQLTNISYTLQIGREDMDYRIALIVNSYEELLDKLKILKNGSSVEDNCWQEHTTKKNILTINDENSSEYIDTLLSENRIKKLAKLWCKGYKVPWQKLYKDKKVKRIPLPEYPFSKDRCWVENIEENQKQQEYDKCFIGNIDISKSMKGNVTYVNEINGYENDRNEFLINYLINASNMINGEKYIKAIKINHKEVDISNNAKIYTSFNFKENEVEIVLSLEEINNLAKIEVINHSYDKALNFDKVNIYKHYTNNYLKGELEEKSKLDLENDWVEELKIGNDAKEALIKLNIDKTDTNTSILNAIKYSISLLSNCTEEELNEVEINDLVINNDIKEAKYLYLKEVSNSKYTLTLANKDGEVRVFIKDYKLTSLNKIMNNFFYEPKYKEIDTIEKIDKKLDLKNSLILYAKEDKELAGQIKEIIKDCVDLIELKDGFESTDDFKSKICKADTVYFLGGINNNNGLPESIEKFDYIQDKGIVNLWKIVKALEKINYEGKKEFKIITNNVYKIDNNDEIQPSTAPVIGLSKSLSKEYKNYNFTIVDISLQDEKLKESLKYIISGFYNEKEFALRTGKVYKRILEPVEIEENNESKFKDKGVYILFGGAGNVGLKISTYLSEKYNANLIWIGRRELNDKISDKIDRVNLLGGNVKYYSADITDTSRINEILDIVEKENGEINGVLNLAMNFEIKRISAVDDEKYIKDSLKAKVYGEYILNEVLKNRNINFVLYFSSGEAFTGNLGWGLYAAACAFSDSLSALKQNDKSYLTYTINWGFWGTLDEDDNEYFRRKGIFPITKEQGSEAMERILASEREQVMALNVSENILKLMGVEFNDKVEAEVESEKETEKYEPEQVKENSKIEDDKTLEDIENIEDNLANKVKEIFAEVLKIKKEKIDVDNDLASYGIDSLIVTSISSALEKKMGKIPVTLIIEKPTIRDIAKELILNHKDKVRKLFNLSTISTSNNNNKVKNIEVLHTIKKDNIEGFLKQYGELYANKKLRNEENSIVYDEFDLNKESDEKMIHFLMNSADESKVEVFEYGKGQPLLFLPAIGLTAPIWIKQFLTLSHKYKMIVIHVPGYGLSDVVKNLGTKKSGEIIVDIIKRLNLKEKVNITASCLGTIVASYLARFYPDIFKTVCLVGGFYDNSDLPNLDSSNLSVEELDTMMKEVSSSIGRDFDSLLNKDLYEEKEILLNSRCANSLAAIRYMNEMLTLNTAEWLKDIKIPALCIYGDRDTVIKPERSKAIHEFIQGSSLKEIKNSAHYPFLTNTEEFNKILELFINN